MMNFSEWLSVQEGSLGLQRRNRVAAGMAKRAALTKQIYPNPSDSRGHQVAGELERDVQAAAGRFEPAHQRMMDRSQNRMAAIARRDKEARQMQAGKGNLSTIQANMGKSDDANRALANYDKPEILQGRGTPNWAAQDGARKFSDLSRSDVAQASAGLSELQRQAELKRIEREKEAKEKHGHEFTTKDRLRYLSGSASPAFLQTRKERLNDLMRPAI